MTETILTVTSNWRCVRINSPAGTWYIARSHRDALEMSTKKRKTNNGKEESRAIFSREEIRNILPQLEKMSPDKRQEWLGEIIKIKQAFQSATVTKIKDRKLSSLVF